jgi:hypothetical protein
MTSLAITRRNQKLPGHCRRRAGILVLSFFVLVALCQTPIPWVHRHGGEEQNGQFAEHLAAYHADGNVEHGWHVHFSMVDDILRGNGCPVPSSKDESDPVDIRLSSSDAITIVSSGTGGDQQACAISIVVGDPHNQNATRHPKIPSGAQHDCACARALLISLCVSALLTAHSAESAVP